MSAKRVPATIVADNPSKTGDIRIGDLDGVVHGFDYVCPCGCGVVDWIPVTSGPSDLHHWHWNGDRDKPTLTPSIRKLNGCQWHGWLTNGEFITC